MGIRLNKYSKSPAFITFRTTSKLTVQPNKAIDPDFNDDQYLLESESILMNKVSVVMNTHLLK